MGREEAVKPGGGEAVRLQLAHASAQRIGRHEAAKAETAPPLAGAPAEPAPPATKPAVLAGLLERQEGAAVAQTMAATGWQAHSVRGAVAGTVVKKLRAKVNSELADGVCTCRAPSL